MNDKKKSISQQERTFLIKDMKINPYHTVNNGFALMTIIPVLVFFYILVAKLFSFSILVGGIGLLVSLALCLAITGYLMTNDVVNSILFYAFRTRKSEMSKSKLVAVLSHELKNPLTAIMGNVELIMDGIYGELSPDQKKALALCYDMASRMNTLTDNLLESHTIETGTAKVKRALVDISSTLTSQENELSLKIKEKHIRLKSEKEGTSFLMWGSEDKLSQVIHNLLSNAIKYTPQNGDINVKLSSEGSELKLVVHNSGAHIPKEELDNIFDHYKRLDTAEEGAGLGLAIVRDIVDLHKGEIWAESSPETGVTFTVLFPRDLRAKRM